MCLWDDVDKNTAILFLGQVSIMLNLSMFTHVLLRLHNARTMQFIVSHKLTHTLQSTHAIEKGSVDGRSKGHISLQHIAHHIAAFPGGNEGRINKPNDTHSHGTTHRTRR